MSDHIDTRGNGNNFDPGPEWTEDTGHLDESRKPRLILQLPGYAVRTWLHREAR